MVYLSKGFRLGDNFFNVAKIVFPCYYNPILVDKKIGREFGDLVGFHYLTPIKPEVSELDPVGLALFHGTPI